MKKLLVTLSFLISLMFASSQSWGLPPCPSKYPFDNCYGSYTWANGDKYIGEWKDNKQHGQGTTEWSNGTKYIGGWKDNKQHGRGTTEWPSGDKHVGEYKNGKRNGLGTYTWGPNTKWAGNKYNLGRNGMATGRCGSICNHCRQRCPRHCSRL